jgi:hypothetical protein
MKISYSEFSTADLISKIAFDKDKKALNEFLENKKLFWLDGLFLALPEFLSNLRKKGFLPFLEINRNIKGYEELLDWIYDLTLDSFSIFKPKNAGTKDKGPYCDRQFSYWHKKISKWKKGDSPLEQVELEQKIGRLLLDTVKRHLNFSLYKALNEIDKNFTDYEWKLPNGKVMILKRPIRIPIQILLPWLEETFKDPDPDRLGEKERIQEKIDERFGRWKAKDYESIKEYYTESGMSIDPLEQEEEEYLSENLSKKVADEKSNSLEKQRRAIRNLGKKKVRELVLKILNAITIKEITYTEIAEEFKISKATLSRFAGQNWQKRGKSKPPDLWKNVAHIIDRNPHLLEEARSMGILDIIKNIVK